MGKSLTRSEAAKKGAVTKKRNIFVSKWIEALRSRKFKQTTGVLHKIENGKDSFCCLGVACEVAKELKLVDLTEREGFQSYDGSNTVLYDGQCYSLPESVREALGLTTIDGAFTDSKGESQDLTDLNDSGKKFTTIAKIIESRPKGLFA